MEDNLPYLHKISWSNINKDGHIEGDIKNEAAIYIFMRLSSEKRARFYIGSSINLASRISTHRSRFNNWSRGDVSNASPIFYNSVSKYGWYNFKFGILESINISNLTDSRKKSFILEREQFYLEIIKPTLNICRIANSPLGVKRNAVFSENLSIARRGKKQNNPRLNSIVSQVHTPKTILKISSRCKGIKVKIFDVNNNLINQYSTLGNAAKALGVTDRTISNILKTGKSYDEFIYKFEVGSLHPIVVLNKKYNSKKEYSSMCAVAKDIRVSRWSVSKYMDTNELLKGIYLISTK